MSKSLRMHQNEVTNIVDGTLREIFKQYFQMDIDLEAFHQTSPLHNALISRSLLSDKEALTVIMLSIEKDMMAYIVGRVFPEGTDAMGEAAQSCINEITNIVSSRVKTYFNECGFDFLMEIPEIINERDISDDHFEILFSAQDNHLSVDIGIEKEHSGYRTVA